jgi:hypothetical protein
MNTVELISSVIRVLPLQWATPCNKRLFETCTQLHG